MKLFKRTSWLIGTIAQLLILIIVVPILLQIISLVVNLGGSGGKADSFVVDLINSIPCFSTWIQLLHGFLQLTPVNGTSRALDSIIANSVVISSTFLLFKTFFQALLSAICSKVFISIHRVVSFFGAPILATFFGVLVATLVNSIFEKNTSLLSIVLWYGGIIVIMIIGFMFLTKSLFATLNMKKSTFVFDLIIDGLSTLITSLYLTVIILAVNGYFGSLSKTIGYCLLMSIVEIVNLVLFTLVSSVYEREKKEGKIS